jgi:hypothetical protein
VYSYGVNWFLKKRAGNIWEFTHPVEHSDTDGGVRLIKRYIKMIKNGDCGEIAEYAGIHHLSERIWKIEKYIDVRKTCLPCKDIGARFR